MSWNCSRIVLPKNCKLAISWKIPRPISKKASWRDGLSPLQELPHDVTWKNLHLGGLFSLKYSHLPKMLPI
jgi:hypothetical protein